MANLKEAAARAAAQNGGKKKRGGAKSFFKGVWAELKKVHWPDRKQLITYTGVVIVAVLLVAIVLSIYDWIIASLLGLIIA